MDHSLNDLTAQRLGISPDTVRSAWHALTELVGLDPNEADNYLVDADTAELEAHAAEWDDCQD